ncbi:MAG: BatA domain-containing protein [Bacteroidota bacterium]
MQFKYPELLWALFLLVIPILIHLFQLRRFKKTPFTNVAMLQKVVAQSRKSSVVKKWLLLFTRLTLLAALVLAFAQPFFAKPNALTKKETIIYLDNSFSMLARANGLTLLERAVQDLVQAVPKDLEFTLFTNTQTFKNVTLEKIQNDLLSMPSSASQLTLEQVGLKANAMFSQESDTEKHLVFISDLQQRLIVQNTPTQITNLHVIQLSPENNNNLAIDSVYLTPSSEDQIPLHVVVSGLENDQTVPISLFDRGKLIAKTAVVGTREPQSTTLLSLQRNEAIQGRLEIEDPVLDFDNHFYFNINPRSKPKVLAISESNSNFLERIFVDQEFDFQSFKLNTLQYSELESQNTIILNGLRSIPTGLSNTLQSFWNAGGTVVIIPPKEDLDLNSYNTFLQGINAVKFEEIIPFEQRITSIAFQHPLYAGVFVSEVQNFDYPTAISSFSVTAPIAQMLSFSSGAPFLLGQDNVFIFTASLEQENSDFINSPLVVPTFYNIGDNSLKNSELYLTLGAAKKVDIPFTLSKDNIVTLRRQQYEFIPLQQSFSNKISLNFEEPPNSEGVYAVMDGKDTLRHLSFNFPRNESVLAYETPESLNPETINSDIANFFTQLQEDNTIVPYWKWFVILALLFAMVELLIQKLL